MMGFGFGGSSFLFMFLFWVVVIALAVWLLSNLFPQTTGDSSSHITMPRDVSPKSALEILKRRYARGEIPRAEFEEMRRDLEG